jgi:hypothetical protein
MSDEERQHIEGAQLLSLLLPLADNSRNVRQLGKTIDTMISLLLVRSALDERRAPNPVQNLRLAAAIEAAGE